MYILIEEFRLVTELREDERHGAANGMAGSGAKLSTLWRGPTKPSRVTLRVTRIALPALTSSYLTRLRLSHATVMKPSDAVLLRRSKTRATKEG
jgi:hypothetical protein